jgi:hypothetical protein
MGLNKPGFNDVVPHQLVRTASDRLYAFVARGNASSLLEAYWTTAAGIPTGGADFAGAAEVDTGGAVVSVDGAYDGDHTVHVLVYRQSGALFVLEDRPFDTATNAFGAAQLYAQAPGAVLRCPSCTAMLMCVVRFPGGGMVVDLTGLQRIRMN